MLPMSTPCPLRRLLKHREHLIDPAAVSSDDNVAQYRPHSRGVPRRLPLSTLDAVDDGGAPLETVEVERRLCVPDLIEKLLQLQQETMESRSRVEGLKHHGRCVAFGRMGMMMIAGFAEATSW